MADFSVLDHKSVTGDWSSIIGIVTAIVGNILISFALNTQRLAHVRLAREQEDEESRAVSPRDNQDRQNGRDNPRKYGAVEREEEIAEQRRDVNARSDLNRQSLEEQHEDEPDERHTLIPHVRSGNGHKKELHSGADEQEEEQDDDDASIQTAKPKRRSYLSSPWWWLGIALMIIGEAGNFLAYGFAPASIVSPLGVVALISNCLIAPIMLHEQFRWRDLLGIIIAVGGAVTVVLSAQGSNPKLGPDDILDLVTTKEFLAYLGTTLGLIVIFMVLSNRIGHRTIVIDIGLVGLLGGYTALSTKGVASLLSYRLWFALTFPIFYLLVTILVATAVLQIKYVNRALQRFDSTRVIPTQFCSFTISVIVGSAILYRDFESADRQKVGTFVGGCLLTFMGVWFLTSARHEDQDDNEPEMPGEEEGIDLVDEDPQLSRSTTSTLDPSINIQPATPTVAKTPYASSTSRSTQQSFKSAFSRAPDTPSPAPRLTATESSPLLPTMSSSTAASSVSSVATETPLRHSRHNSAMTPPFGPISGSTTMPSSGRPRRKSLAHRASIANIDLSPGPLTTPLSGGLSVVVADQRGRMRRGSSLRETIRNVRGVVPGSLGRSAPRPLSDAFDGTASQSGIVSERPRMGRGNTAEVVPPPTAGSNETVRPGKNGKAREDNKRSSR